MMPNSKKRWKSSFNRSKDLTFVRVVGLMRAEPSTGPCKISFCHHYMTEVMALISDLTDKKTNAQEGLNCTQFSDQAEIQIRSVQLLRYLSIQLCSITLQKV